MKGLEEEEGDGGWRRGEEMGDGVWEVPACYSAFRYLSGSRNS